MHWLCTLWGRPIRQPKNGDVNSGHSRPQVQGVGTIHNDHFCNYSERFCLSLFISVRPPPPPPNPRKANPSPPLNPRSITFCQLTISFLTCISLVLNISSTSQRYGAMTTRPHFMRPCKSSSLGYRSLFDMSHLVKNKNGICVFVLIGPHKLGPKKHGQFVPMVKTLINVER